MKNSKTTLTQVIEKAFSLKLTYSPLVFFVLFLTADALLVFARAPLAADLAILLFGILVPFVLALVLLKNPVSASDNHSFFRTEWFEVGPWLWILLTVLFVVTRFYKLKSLPWPVFDDGYVAYYANRLVTQGDWRILYGAARQEPLFIWGLAAWFKMFQSSLLALKTFPILVYVGVLTTGYFGVRQYFSKSISFIALWFLTFNFWTFFINRQCEAALSLLLFECLAFYFLGKILLLPAKRHTKLLWFLAFCIGIGFYTYTAWPVVAVMATLPIILRTQYQLSQSVKRLIGFILIPLILVLPLIHARFSSGGLTYIQSCLNYPDHYPAGLDYIEEFFWNGLGIIHEDPSTFGWLNPCLGALFLIGFLELWRYRLSKFAQWGLLAFLLFLLPGVVTNYVEMYHIIPILPLICVFAALGVQALFSTISLSNGKNVLLFLLAAIFSLGLDVYHYAGPGQLHDWNFWISNKRHFDSIDFSRAYPILEAADRNHISLLMITDLNNNLNQTLNVVTGPFDEVCSRGGWVNSSAQKAALLVNSNYEPFLKEEFPDSEWTWLSPDIPNDYGGFGLGFIPINSDTDKILERFKKADEIFKQNNVIFTETVSNPTAEALKDLYAHYSVFQGDRFLESVFWEKVAYYEKYQNKIPEAVGALKNTTKDGYATAQFYTELGDLFAYFGHKKEAEGYFEKAIACPVNRTTAVEKLKQLKSI